MRFGDVLNAWFRSMGRNWKPLLMSALIAHVPLAIVIAIVFWANGSVDSFALYTDPDLLETMSSEAIVAALTPLMWTFVIWAVLQFPVGAFVYLAAAHIVTGDIAGTNTSTREATRQAVTSFGRGFASIVLVSVAALLLLGAAVVLGWVIISAIGGTLLTVFLTAVVALTALVILVRFGISLSFGIPIIAVEGSGPVSALTRSYRLVHDRWWITLGFILLTGLLVSTASQVVSIVVSPLLLVGAMVPSALALTFGISVLIQAPILAAFAAAYALWYLDLRARKEPLSTDQLAAP